MRCGAEPSLSSHFNGQNRAPDLVSLLARDSGTNGCLTDTRRLERFFRR